MAARKWSEEQKAAQSVAINSWKPWKHSTGAKSSKGKAISKMNAHRGYFRRRLRLGQWLLWAKHHTSFLTPELIAETIARSDKLGIQLTESEAHGRFFDDMANSNAEVAVALIEAIITSLRISELFQVSTLTIAARQTVLGRY
jgi:hypothetical protein